ncbi:MAG: amylo-alpha-1,6-glucosidase [Candidatus Woesearchaeota archaeon]
MKIIHSFNHIKIEKITNEENIGFIITNKIGGFFSLGLIENFTKYNGCFISFENNDGFDLIKTIESIKLSNINLENIDNNKISLINNYGNYTKKTQDITESYNFKENILFYEVNNYNGFIDIFFDKRKIYDFHDEGRIYKIYKEKNALIVEYTKYDNNSLTNECYKIFTVILGFNEYSINNQWIEKIYEYDKSREINFKPMYIYNALKLKVDNNLKLIFCSSKNKNEAILKAKLYYENFNTYISKIEQKKKKFLENKLNNLENKNIKNNLNFKDNEELMAYICAQNSLSSLITTIDEKKGIFAGLGWFHQFWTRDEAISTKALIINKEYTLAKKILLRHLDYILEDGRISNRWPKSMLGSADGVGWTFKRIHDLIYKLNCEKLLHKYIDNNEFNKIKKCLRKSIVSILNNYSKDGLIYNHKLETWMDTAYNLDYRSGFRIEIQALMLSMYKLMRLLCLITKNTKKYELYAKNELITKEKIKKLFFKDSILYDELNDPTQRPNVFLTHYIYPKLFKKNEWKIIFKNALKKLWLDFGGIATIDKNHNLFFKEHTGENNFSYHRGDSWYFINNITAISLYKIDKNLFKEEIEKILNASVNDILYKGFIGNSSELSSASKQEAKASLMQAWSASTLIELFNKIRKNN